MGVIQQNLNQGLSTLSFIATQSPLWKEGVDKYNSIGKLNKLNKLNKLDQKQFNAVFPTDDSIEKDEGGETFHKYYQQTEPLRQQRGQIAKQVQEYDPLNKKAFNTLNDIKQERLSDEEYSPYESAQNRKSYAAPMAEFVQQRHMQMKNMRRMIGLAQELKKEGGN